MAAVLIDQANWPYWATLPVAAMLCFLVGYLFGLPALRLEGHYLALATFALAASVRRQTVLWPSGTESS